MGDRERCGAYYGIGVLGIIYFVIACVVISVW